MDAMVYRVSLLLLYRVSLLLLYRVSLLPDAMLDVPDQVLSLRSPGRKNSASPSLLSGLFGGWESERWAAGTGGTGACTLLRPEPLRFVTPGIYAI